jgi:hypothetical protein
MKKLLINALLLLSTFASGQTDSFRYKRAVPAPVKAGFYSIPLSPSIVANCEEDLADLRLYSISKDTAEIPFLLRQKGDVVTEREVPFQRINDSRNEKCCSYLTLKFPEVQQLTRIRLEVEENNFDKTLSLEGSNNNKDWFTISERMRITRFRGNGQDYSYTTLNFSPSEYIYFRLKFDDDNNERITVTGAYAYVDKVQKGEYEELKVIGQEQRENKKEKISEVFLTLDAKYRINHLLIPVSSNEDYFRNINVYAAGDSISSPKGKTESWQLVGSSVINSVQSTTIAIGNIRAQRLRIDVMNHSNMPLMLGKISVHSQVVEMVAKISAASKLELHYGNSLASTAVYDLVHFTNKIPSDLPVLQTLKEELARPQQASAEAQPLFKQKYWLWIGMGIMILVIGYFALRMIKAEKDPAGQSEDSKIP